MKPASTYRIENLLDMYLLEKNSYAFEVLALLAYLNNAINVAQYYMAAQDGCNSSEFIRVLVGNWAASQV
jgi:hypothetical protein